MRGRVAVAARVDRVPVPPPPAIPGLGHASPVVVCRHGHIAEQEPPGASRAELRIALGVLLRRGLLAGEGGALDIGAIRALVVAAEAISQVGIPRGSRVAVAQPQRLIAREPEALV